MLPKVFDSGGIHLYQGDCRNLELITPIQLLLTGPPYAREPATEFELLSSVFEKAKNWLVEGGIMCLCDCPDFRRDGLIDPRHILVLELAQSKGFKLYDYKIWQRGYPWNLYRIMFSHILIFFNGIKPRIKRPTKLPDIISEKAPIHKGFRDATPPGLTSLLIQGYSNPEDTVLDVFAGTGTTLVEAIKLGRLAIGCEIDPKMIEFCVRRICQLHLPQ